MIVYQRFVGSGGLSCNTKVYTTNFKDPRIKNPGVFCFVEGKMEKEIDYTKLQERIVEQAYESILTKEDFQKLIQDKFERAKIYSKSLNTCPTFSVN
jgi:hypothetical protein